MTLSNICDLFDSFYIAEKAEQLNCHYISSSTNIYTDGKYKQQFRSDGYIDINNLVDASYIIFLDQNGDIFISIYKYIHDSKFKDILDILNKIRESTGVAKHNIIHNEEDNKNKKDIKPTGRLIDINTFVCPDCDQQMIWTKASKNSDTLVAYCKDCNIEYALIPSKYYVIKAKKKLFKAGENFRNLKDKLSNKGV